MILLSEELGCSKRSVERIVDELKGEAVLERRGSTRSGSWVLVAENENYTEGRTSQYYEIPLK